MYVYKYIAFIVCSLYLHVVAHGAEPLEHVDGEGRRLDGDQCHQHPAARVEWLWNVKGP